MHFKSVNAFVDKEHDYNIICQKPIYVSGKVKFTYRLDKINKKFFLKKIMQNSEAKVKVPKRL